MTPPELAAILAAPLTATPWRELTELTPSQLSSILAALAAAGQTAHLQTGGATPTVTYTLGDGGTGSAIGGTDSSGQASASTFAGAAGDILHVAFLTAFGFPPNVTVFGLDAASAALLPVAKPVTAAGFTINIAVAAGPSTNYSFGWIAVGQPS